MLPVRSGPFERRVLVSLIWILLALGVVPAIFAYRQISRYARLPLAHARIERVVTCSRPGRREMSEADGLAVSPDGSVVVADTNRGRVLAFPCGRSECGSILKTQGSPVPLQAPLAVAFTPAGELLALDGATGFVHRFGSDGSFLGTGKMAESGAQGIAVDSEGNIFVADSAAHLIRKYLPSGVSDLDWTDGSGEGAVGVDREVLGIATRHGDVYVTMARPHAIVRLDRHGRRIGVEPLVGNAGRLAWGPGGRLYMSDLPTGRLWVLDPDGHTVGRVVGPGDDERIARQPRGIGFDRDGRLYVADDDHVTVFAGGFGAE